MKKNALMLLFFIAFLIIGGGLFLKSNFTGKDIKVTMYKSQSCGCCVRYAPYLKDNGFEVKVKIVPDISIIKKKYGVPANLESCHTIVMGDYFIEGHIPIKAIKKLIKERPDIDGISLPGMPSGAPGMPGDKMEKFIVYSISNGKSSKFMTI